ncbi:MAG: hypothetical protein BWY93_01694 [Euryarchaeota archaeon ADurb.BinA087]|nr:MAG: hypothetical protein BWY93_01694 [Euryarchaeota archaeon ADurb.BinA087]
MRTFNRPGDVVCSEHSVHEEHPDSKHPCEGNCDGDDLCRQGVHHRWQLCFVEVEKHQVDERTASSSKEATDNTAYVGYERQAMPLGSLGLEFSLSISGNRVFCNLS